MKSVLSTLPFCLTLLLLSCGKPHPDNAQKEESLSTETAPTQDSLENKPLAETSNAVFDEQPPKNDSPEDCVRAVASPIVDKKIYPNTTFKLLDDKSSGVETVNFKNGDRLTIFNFGCENFSLTFNFETSEFTHDQEDIAYWYPVAIQLMKRMLPALDAPVNLEGGIEELQRYYDAGKKDHFQNLNLDHILYYGDSEIQSRVSFDKEIKLKDNKHLVSVIFSLGPL